LRGPARRSGPHSHPRRRGQRAPAGKVTQMTSQRDETVGHISGDEMADDPIVVERHDEILGGPPVDDPDADDAFARDAAAASPRAGAPDDTPPPDDERATGRPAGDELAGDEPASDELAGRHAAP